MASMNIDKAFRNNRLFKSLTGCTISEFRELEPEFGRVLARYASEKERKRAVGGGRKSTVDTPAKKLFFMLFYLKCYPTLDLAGFIFGVDRSQPCRWVQELLPVLEEVLGMKAALPKRKIGSMDEFLEAFPGVKDIFIDGTERPVQRPGNERNQKRRYSGKKKRHTRKNTVAGTENRRVGFLSPTKNGRIHDMKQLEKTGILSHIPPGITVWVDSGYQGIKKLLKTGVNVMIPKKKSKNYPLTAAEKEENRVIAGIRVVIENTIGGIKRYGSLTQVYRNRKGQDDKFIYLASGLWNFHLDTTQSCCP
jgi:hypothetical protein